MEQELLEIKVRNKQKELDKAWETSFFRKVVVAIFTYLAIVLFFYFAQLPSPLVNAIVPTLGFILSTMSLPLFKTFWLKHIYQNKQRGKEPL